MLDSTARARTPLVPPWSRDRPQPDKAMTADGDCCRGTSWPAGRSQMPGKSRRLRLGRSDAGTRTIETGMSMSNLKALLVALCGHHGDVPGPHTQHAAAAGMPGLGRVHEPEMRTLRRLPRAGSETPTRSRGSARAWRDSALRGLGWWVSKLRRMGPARTRPLAAWCQLRPGALFPQATVLVVVTFPLAESRDWRLFGYASTPEVESESDGAR